MVLLSSLAAIAASVGWASGTVLAERPARSLGSFAFIRVQVVACSAILIAFCSVGSLWSTVSLEHWPMYAVSTCALLIGLLSFTSCLRSGGPRRSEIVFSLRAPIVAVMAYAWLGETLSLIDILGGALCLSGIVLAVLSKDQRHQETVSNTKHHVRFFIIGFVGVTCQGLAYLIVKPALESGTSPFAVSAIHLTGAAIIVFIVATWPSPILRPHTALTPSLAFRAVLPGVIGYVFASSALLYAFSTLNGGIAAVLGSLAPVLVIPIQAIRDRQFPTMGAVLGAAAAVSGAALIVVF